jgi:hypothetical protein
MRKQEQLYRPTEDNRGIPPQGDYIKHTSSEVKPSYVTFEQAKWLQEKGFDVDTETCFHALLGYDIDTFMKWDNGRGYLVRPEHWQVVEWLRLNHNLHLFIDCNIKKNLVEYWYNIKGYKLSRWSKLTEKFESPQEAYSAAFDSIKNSNLI